MLWDSSSSGRGKVRNKAVFEHGSLCTREQLWLRPWISGLGRNLGVLYCSLRGMPRSRARVCVSSTRGKAGTVGCWSWASSVRQCRSKGTAENNNPWGGAMKWPWCCSWSTLVAVAKVAPAFLGSSEVDGWEGRAPGAAAGVHWEGQAMRP